MALFNTASTAMPTAYLPAQLLHVAAQFASIDPFKQTLTGILVRPAKDGGIRIDSTDGTRAFSVTCPDATWECEEPMLLSAKAFKKRISYAKVAQFDSIDGDNTRILGGKGSLTDIVSGDGLQLLQAMPAVWRQEGYEGDPIKAYPNVDQIWPDQFGRNADTSITFSATLLADFLTEVKRYSCNDRVTMKRNGPLNPMVFTATMSGPWLDEVEMRFLLMPIQVRD